MVDKEHASLTGASLHEPKGVASATSGQIYIANGAGSGAWTATTGIAGVFGNSKYHVRDQVTSGSAGGSNLTNSSWNTRRVQTEITDDISASVASNQITLPAGTYVLFCSAYSYFSWNSTGSSSANGQSQLRLRNVTGSTTLLTGIGEYVSMNLSSTGHTGRIPMFLTMVGQFTVAGSQALEIQQWRGGTSDGGGSTITPGAAISTGENEVYLDAIFWKIS